MNERITKQAALAFKQDILEQTMLINTAEAATMLGCSERAVIELVRDGQVHAYNRNGRAKGVRLLASELKECIHSLRIDQEKWQE